MAKRLALKARLKRLEQRQARKRFTHRRVICSIAERLDSDVVGISDGDKLHVPRLAGEALADLERRSRQVIPRFAFYAYSTPSAPASEAESGFEGEATPSAA